MSDPSSTDRIQKRCVLKAPLERVWRAISNAKEFGEWFRLELEGEFVEGQAIHGRITYPGYEHVRAELLIQRIQPPSYFAYRWHPAAVDPGVDYTAEPTTLVEYQLREVEEGTELTITESGFDQLPPARRAEAFRSNDGGWTIQVQNIESHVARR
jgi:uncharacterized protein YndB with AHSA1/START domain